MVTMLAAGLGGLGIFFAGMYLLAENLKKLTGRRFRQAVAAWTKTTLAGTFWGLVSGAVMQSTSALTFIVVSMLGSGLLTVESGLAIIIGCNVGTTLLVVIATLDIHIFVLVMLGLSGVSFASERLVPARAFLLAVFGIGLVFLGLDMLQNAAAPLAGEPWVRNLMSQAGSSYILVFLIALALSVVTQSTNSISLLAITLTVSGVFSFDQAVMAIYGANVGSSVLTYLLSANLKGRQRQVSMFQASFNFIAAFIMIPVFYFEVYSGVPVVRTIVGTLSSDTALQLAYVYVLFNVVGGIVLLPLVGPTTRLLAQLYPPPPEESDAQPHYIFDRAVQEPETALDLAALEQQRLASYLPRLLDIARVAPKGAETAINRLQQTIGTLASTIDEFLDRLGETPISHSGYERLNQALIRERLLDGLAETLADLARAVAAAGSNPTTGRLTGNVVEGTRRHPADRGRGDGTGRRRGTHPASPDGGRPQRADEAAPRGVSRQRHDARRRRQDDDPHRHQPDRTRLVADQPAGPRAAAAGTGGGEGRAVGDAGDMTGSTAGRTLTLRLDNRLDAIAPATEEIERFCQDHGVPAAAIGHLNLALDEALTNTISYAWPTGGDHQMTVTLQIGADEIEAEISDDGIAFNPLEVPPPDLDADLDDRPVGGLGVHFVKTLMDSAAYRREDGRNVLVLRKSL